MVSSCEDQGILKADRNFLKGENLKTAAVDTFLIKTSTVLIDSIPTSGASVLVGSYTDDLMGQVNSSAYFKVRYDPDNTGKGFMPDTNWVYDSVQLIMHYNNYSQGDTLKPLTLNINELTEEITPRTIQTQDRVSFFSVRSSMYNTSKVNFSSTPIASHVVKFRPNRDSISLTLPKAFGARFYNVESQVPGSIKDISRSNFTPKADWFKSAYFKGVNLSTIANTNACIVGFIPSKVTIRIYYTIGIPERDNQKASRIKDFNLILDGTNFNNITSDRVGSATQALQNLVAIPSAATNHTTYVQAGVGVYTKIEFPTLAQFFLNPDIIMLEATLEVPVAQNTYMGNTKPPRLLSLYTTDKTNIINGILPAGNSPLTGRLFFDSEYQRTTYSFPLINFIQSQLVSNASSFRSLVLTTPAANTPTRDFFSEVTRVAIGSPLHPTNKMKLKVVYTQYSTNK